MSATLRRDDELAIEQLPDMLNGQPHERARVILAAARSGELEAQVLLGQILLNGDGIERDPKLALTWFRICAQRGSAMASNMLGRCHEHGWGCAVDLPAAAGYYHQAAAQELDWGQYNLANLYATGRGVPRDPALAFQLYRRAAEQGHAKSMNLVGRCYEEGLGVAANPTTALLWYQRSAQGGDFRGQFSYAGMLAAQGQIAEAESWLQRALQSGNLNFLRVARGTLQQAPDERLRNLALAYHQRAAELGDDSDQQVLANYLNP